MKLILGINSLRKNLSLIKAFIESTCKEKGWNYLSLRESQATKGSKFPPNISVEFEGDQSVFHSGGFYDVLLAAANGDVIKLRDVKLFLYQADKRYLQWWQTEAEYMQTQTDVDRVWNFLFPAPKIERKVSAAARTPDAARVRNPNGGIEARRNEMASAAVEKVDPKAQAALYETLTKYKALDGLMAMTAWNDQKLGAATDTVTAKRVRTLRTLQAAYQAQKEAVTA